MDKASIIGIILGFATLILGMIAKGANPATLLNPAALIIIGVGVTACIFICFPWVEIKKIPKLIKIIFTDRKQLMEKDLLPLFMEWADIARKEGVLGLEEKISQVEHTFLKSGMEMVLEGQSPEDVRHALEEELAATEERHNAGSSIFTQAGTYAPTLGVLGAVMGLVSALGHLDNMELLGPSISAAFIATLFGIFTGYVIAHPFATKLKRKSKVELQVNYFIIEGISCIQNGESKLMVRKKLLPYLAVSERADETKKGGE